MAFYYNFKTIYGTDRICAIHILNLHAGDTPNGLSPSDPNHLMLSLIYFAFIHKGIYLNTL